MNLVIFENGTFEEEKALVDIDSGEIFLNGDYYHDKIDDKISGFLYAARHFGAYRGEVPTKEIGKDDDWFGKLGFYDDGYEEEDEE